MPVTQKDETTCLGIAAVLLICSCAGVKADAGVDVPADAGEGESGVELWEDWEGTGPEPDDPTVNWMDTSHLYLTNQTQALANWMDSFFGDETYDAEQAESIIRLEFIEDYNHVDGGSFRTKVRGRVHLPRLSKRMSLTFSGEDDDDPLANEFLPTSDEDSIGLQYNRRTSKTGRLDYTLDWASSHLRPGIRYRYYGQFNPKTLYRLTERIQYEHSNNFFSKTQFRVTRLLDYNRILHWSNRFKYGEETEGVEWSTQLSFLHRRRVDHPRPIALSYFAKLSGFTRPDNFIDDYRIGLLYRRKATKEFIFYEFEPSVSYRKLEARADREVVWGAILRLEIALSKDPPLLR